jgi:RNA polymerase sigma-70 factor (ECF subfamily)
VPEDSRLTEWFHKWRTPLRKFLVARWSVARSDLDDVAQEVFLRLLRYERVELIEHPQAYLYKMAANVVTEWSMKARNRYRHDDQWLGELPSGATPESEMVKADARVCLYDALQALPPRPREMLRLYFGEGLSRAQIAERLAVSPRIVKRDLIVAYTKLRQLLDENVIDSLLMENPE